MRLSQPVIDRLKLGVWSVVLSLLVLEGAFRQPFIIARLSWNEPVYDARVGFRPNPLDPDHDARGWRNSSALSRADIVVFGDSQTYGLYVPRDAAWPQRLGYFLHRDVYQMAFNGYGPAHYVPLLDEALARQAPCSRSVAGHLRAAGSGRRPERRRPLRWAWGRSLGFVPRRGDRPVARPTTAPTRGRPRIKSGAGSAGRPYIHPLDGCSRWAWGRSLESAFPRLANRRPLATRPRHAPPPGPSMIPLP